jgi:hypothetical protein
MIDIRAKVTCSLGGEVISASISDDYIQGSGLIKTQGSCELKGIFTPNIGTIVTFNYTKAGVTRKIPRTLRVLSSFADPFRRITQIEMGCKLAYLSDKQERINWRAFDDTDNDQYDEDDAKIITLPISAKSVMSKCLQELGVEASSSPLTNKFSIEEFDLSSGYVNVLSDLLVSECYCGYLNENEKLIIFSLNQSGENGPVITEDKIIDIGPIGVGQLPGEAVTVAYSTLKLQKPEAVENNTGGGEDSSKWEKNISQSFNTVIVPYEYTSNNQKIVDTAIYPNLEISESTLFFDFFKDNEGKTVRRISKRVAVNTTGTSVICGAALSAYLNNGIPFNNFPVSQTTVETYQYDKQGNEIAVESITQGSSLYLTGSLSVPFVLPNGSSVNLINNYITIGKKVILRKFAGDAVNETTYNYGPWYQTISGQQTIAESRNIFSTSQQVVEFINALGIGGELQLIDSSTNISIKGPAAPAVSAADVNNANNSDGGDPNNGWRTESTAELELALGSATAQRRIELSLPYAPDDIFFGPSGGPYTSIASDAPQKAKLYGQTQNRLLLGNRNGMNIQLAPELLPVRPFAKFAIQANGTTAIYATNGTSWTMNSDGIIVSTDALLVGALAKA